MYEITEWVKKELKENAEQEYREFHKSLVPGLETLLGVRIPKLREIAKKAAREGYWEYVREADLTVYEELMIRGMMIGYGKLSASQQREELEAFVPRINNWAVCDSCCTTYKFMKKNQQEWFSFLLPYLESQREYEIRFAVVCMLDFFINEDFILPVLDALKNLRQEAYYVKMAAAWALSVCYVKFPKQTEPLFAEGVLDDFTHNKALQKIRESYRVSKEEKERLRMYVRPAAGAAAQRRN